MPVLRPVHSSFDVTVVAVTGTDAAPTVTDAAPTVTVDALDQAAKARWEAVLHYMLRIDQEARPSSDVIRLLERAHLIGSKAERRDRYGPCQAGAHRRGDRRLQMI